MLYMPQDMETVSGSKFFVQVAGTTNGAHRPIVERFKRYGQTEVTSPEQCDYLLLFCPISSRVGTDVSEALDHIPAGKSTVLVVMHHTFNRHQIVAPSSRLVQNPDVVLTMDCLFHEKKLLSCDLNNKMWNNVYNFLGVSQCSLRRIFPRRKVFLIIFIFIVMVLTKIFHHHLFDQTKSGYMQEDMETESRSKFFVQVAGTTNGAHRPIVERFKGEGQTEVTSPEQCDYLLVFCPISSRVGTDISEALDHVPAGKPAVLVVMHYNFSHYQVVAESSRLVKHPNILLTMDCPFHKNQLSNCDLDDKMWTEVLKFLRGSKALSPANLHRIHEE